MKRLFLAVLIGLVLCTSLVWSQTFQKQTSQPSQTSGFTQQGKVTQEMQLEGLSIAHSSLPLNSTVKVTNPSNGKSTEATVVRLIPAALGRIADVSAGVWRELELTPITDVRISAAVSVRPQALPPPPPVVVVAPPVVEDLEPETSVIQTTASQTIIVQAPASQAPAAQAPAAQAPAAQTTAPQTIIVQAPASQAPASQAPASQAPASQAPASQAPASQAPAPQTVVVQAPSATPQVAANPTPQAAVTQAPAPRAAVTQTSEPGDYVAPAPRTTVTQAPAPQAAVTQAPAPRAAVTQTSDPGDYVAPAPRTTVVQTPAPQTAAPQTAVAAAPRTVTPSQPVTTTTQSGTASLGDSPGGIKFENTNNFIINGNPAGVVPSASTYDTPAPAVTYQAPALPSQPAVTYQSRPQPAQSATIVDKWPQQTQPAVTYQAQPQTQSAAFTDNWPRQTSPAVTYQTPPQPAQPLTITDNWSQKTQPAVTYQAPPQPGQSAAFTDSWPLQPQSTVTYQSPQPAAAFDMRPQQTNQTAVASATNPQQTQGDIWAQIAKPTTLVETRTVPAQQDKGPSYNDVLASASRTNVFIDAPAGTPRPSVTVNNGTLSYMPPVPNEMRPQPVQAPTPAASYVTAPANSNVRIENWPPQGSQPVKRIEEMPHPRVAASEVIQQTANMPSAKGIAQEAQRAQSTQTSQTSQPSVKFENWTKPGQSSQSTVNSVVTTPGSNPVINYETHTIEVPVNQAGVPLWNEIKPPNMNEIYSPVPNSRVFIDAPVDTLVPNVIINNSRGVGSRE